MKARYWFDVLALIIIGGYVWLAQATEQGAADPVWRRIQDRKTIVVATDIGFHPFVEQEPDGSLSGYDVALMEEIARRLGVKIEWRQAGYDALFNSIDPGNPNQADVLAAGVALNPAEGWRVRYTSAYFDAGPQLLVAPNSPIRSQSDLAGKTVTVQLGSPAETTIRQYATADPSIIIDNSAQTQAEAVQHVLAGRADAAVVENIIALPYVYRQEARVAASLAFEPYVLAMPISAYQLQTELNRILTDLQNEGWLADLNERVFR